MWLDIVGTTFKLSAIYNSRPKLSNEKKQTTLAYLKNFIQYHTDGVHAKLKRLTEIISSKTTYLFNSRTCYFVRMEKLKVNCFKCNKSLCCSVKMQLINSEIISEIVSIVLCLNMTKVYIQKYNCYLFTISVKIFQHH